MRENEPVKENEVERVCERRCVCGEKACMCVYVVSTRVLCERERVRTNDRVRENAE